MKRSGFARRCLLALLVAALALQGCVDDGRGRRRRRRRRLRRRPAHHRRADRGRGHRAARAQPHQRALRRQGARQRHALQPQRAADRRGARRERPGPRSRRSSRGVPNVRGVTNEMQVAGAVPPERARQRRLPHLQGQGALRRRAASSTRSTSRSSPRTAWSTCSASSPQPEANDAVEIARTTGGVRKVVQGIRVLQADRSRPARRATRPRPRKPQQQ